MTCLLDGIDNNTSINAGSIGRNGIAYTPSVDAVEEFKVKTNNFSAEYGRSAGAIISASLKSGTNDFRGSAWEFVRNEKFDANNFFSNANRVARQPFKQNQYRVHARRSGITFPRCTTAKTRPSSSSTMRRRAAAHRRRPAPSIFHRWRFAPATFSSYAPRIYDPNARRIGPSAAVISTPFPGNIIPAEPAQ